jgi:hypothetical protein
MYLHVLLHELCCLVHSDSFVSTAEELVVMYILRNTLRQLNTVLPNNEIRNTGLGLYHMLFTNIETSKLLC